MGALLAAAVVAVLGVVLVVVAGVSITSIVVIVVEHEVNQPYRHELEVIQPYFVVVSN